MRSFPPLRFSKLLKEIKGNMNMEFYRSASGMPLSVVQTQKFKTEFLSLSAVLPIKEGETPLTSLLLSVLHRGCEGYPTIRDLNRRLDYLFGTELAIRNYYVGDNQVVGFSANLLGARHLGGETSPLAEVLDLVRRILFCPCLDKDGNLLEKYVEDEKINQIHAIRSLKNNPGEYARAQCRTLFFEGRPCALPIYGTEEEIHAVTPARLTEHWKHFCASFAPFFFYVGDADPMELETAIRNAFPGDFPLVQSVSLSPTKKVAEERVVTEPSDAGQSHLCFGLTTPAILGDPAYYATQLFNEMLGASPISKLFMNVREKLSLCYSCSSSYRPSVGGIFIHCGLKREDRARAEEAIRRQIADLAEGRFTEEEFSAAQKSLLFYYASIEDSPSSMENYFSIRRMIGEKTGLEQTRAALCALTPDDVVRAAKSARISTVFFLEGNGREEDADEDN